MFLGIREQFPLLPQEETIIIAEELGIKHLEIQKQAINCYDNGLFIPPVRCRIHHFKT